MTADEIRESMKHGPATEGGYVGQCLLEIAAQVAELNAKFDRIADNIMLATGKE